VFDADHAIPDIQVIVPRKRIQFRKLVDGEEVPCTEVPKFPKFILGVLGIVNFKTSRYTYFEQ